MLKYTVITFISDVGGILGIFIGFSFWSVHSALIAPIFKRFESKKKSDYDLAESQKPEAGEGGNPEEETI